MKIRWKIKEIYNTVRYKAEEDPLYIPAKLSVILGSTSLILALINFILLHK